MYPETPTISHLLGGMREHDVAGRVAGRLTDAFDDNQQGRNLPVANRCEQWHREHLDDIAEDSNRPELPGSIAQSPRDQAQSISKQFAKACHNRHSYLARSEQGQIGTNDTARALISEVREKAHDADQQNELQRCSLCS